VKCIRTRNWFIQTENGCCTLNNFPSAWDPYIYLKSPKLWTPSARAVYWKVRFTNIWPQNYCRTFTCRFLGLSIFWPLLGSLDYHNSTKNNKYNIQHSGSLESNRHNYTVKGIISVFITASQSRNHQVTWKLCAALTSPQSNLSVTLKIRFTYYMLLSNDSIVYFSWKCRLPLSITHPGPLILAAGEAPWWHPPTPPTQTNLGQQIPWPCRPDKCSKLRLGQVQSGQKMIKWHPELKPKSWV